MTDKASIVKKLKTQVFFWSYTIENPDAVPDEILIEEVLRYGDVEDIQWAFAFYGRSEVFKIWKKHLIPDDRIYRHNYYLSRVFFDINEPHEFLKKNARIFSRYERIRLSDTGNKGRIN